MRFIVRRNRFVRGEWFVFAPTTLCTFDSAKAIATVNAYGVVIGQLPEGVTLEDVLRAAKQNSAPWVDNRGA